MSNFLPTTIPVSNNAGAANAKLLLIKSDHYSLDDDEDDHHHQPAFCFHDEQNNNPGDNDDDCAVPFINLISPKLISINKVSLL